MASGGDPRALLNALSSMLGPSGCIKSAQEVVRIISYMKDAKQTMSQCVYLDILKATSDHQKTLEKFVTAGGWEVLNKWLNEARESSDTCLLSNILLVLKYLPVSITILKQGNTGKIVKSLIKQIPEVKDVATDILEQWKEVVRKETGVTDASAAVKRKKDKLEDESELAKKARVAAKAANSNSIKSESQNSRQQNDAPINSNQIKKQSVKAQVLNKTKAMPVNVTNKPKMVTPAPVATVTDSSSFMDALSVSVTKKKPKKLPTSSSKGSQQPTQTTTSPVDKSFPTQPVSPDHDDNSLTVSEPVIQSVRSEILEEKNPSEDIEKTSNSIKPVKAGKKRKSVTWASEPNLTRFHYFELDESERVNVRSQSFHDAQYNEMMRERQTLQSAKFQGADNMKETITWTRPAIIEFTTGRGGQITDRRIHSDEFVLQEKREQTVLAEIYFSKDRVSDNPAEPDTEDMPSQTLSKEPVIIPLIPAPDPDVVDNAPHVTSTDTGGFTLAPEIANLINSAASSVSKLGFSDSDAAKAVELAAQMMHKGSYPDEQYPNELDDRISPRYENEELNHEYIEDHQFHYPYDHPEQPPDRYLGHGPPMRGKRFPGGRGGGPRMQPWRGGPPGPDGPPLRGMNPSRGQRMPMDHPDMPPFEDDFGPYLNEEFPHAGPAPGHRSRGGHPPRGRSRRGGRSARGGRGGGDPGEPRICRHFVKKGHCRYGDECSFLHPGVNGPYL